jgi:hypothetical protein
MKTTIQIDGVKASIEDGLWTCDDLETITFLEAEAADRPPMEGSDPDPDYTEATRMAALYGAAIIDYAGPPEIEEGAVY